MNIESKMENPKEINYDRWSVVDKIACKCAKEKPQSYYKEPFVPHEWVLKAMYEYAIYCLKEKNISSIFKCEHSGEEFILHDNNTFEGFVVFVNKPDWDGPVHGMEWTGNIKDCDEEMAYFHEEVDAKRWNAQKFDI